MADLIKKRKRLAPVRLELSRQLDSGIVDLLCKQLEVNKKNLFSETALLLICHFCSRYRIYSDRKPSFFYKKRVPQRFTAFDDNKPILPQIKKKTDCFLILLIA